MTAQECLGSKGNEAAGTGELMHLMKHWEAEGVVFQMKCESKALSIRGN